MVKDLRQYFREQWKYYTVKRDDRKLFKNFYLKRADNKKDSTTSNCILIIRLDAIGDSVIWLDQAKEYRKAFPNHKLVLFHNISWKDIAERLPYFDVFISFNPQETDITNYYTHKLEEINKYSYEKLFSPIHFRSFFIEDWFVHNINAKEKIGYESDGVRSHKAGLLNKYYRKHIAKYSLLEIGNNWYSKIVPSISNNRTELQRNADFVRATMNPDFKSSLPSFPFLIPKVELIPSTEYVVFSMGSSAAPRRWPVSNFVKITEYIPYDTIVLCGSANESSLGDSFIDTYNGTKKIIPIFGKTSLLELISIIKYAKLVVTNETSTSHISVATRTPSICLLGGGHYGLFQPYVVDELAENEKKIMPINVSSEDKLCFGCDWDCKYLLLDNCWKCIFEISVNSVIKAIDEFTRTTK
jgi:ADP-heptose:LPS heptosyltransferase